MAQQYQWVEWMKQLQAIAQNGLSYSQNEYDLERYRQIQQIIVDILKNHTNHDTAAINDFLSEETGYRTPKVDVRGVVFRDDSILLVKERSDGKWTLPGGWADVCLTPSENVVKEIFEESGYRTRAIKLLAVYDRDKHAHTPKFPYHVYKFFFLCEIIGGSPQTSIETEDVKFFKEDEIPSLSLSKVTPEQIARMFVFYHGEAAQTEFD